jgi:hypothetical protein
LKKRSLVFAKKSLFFFKTRRGASAQDAKNDVLPNFRPQQYGPSGGDGKEGDEVTLDKP